MKIISFPGDMGIKNIKQLFGMAADALKEEAECVIDLSEVRRIDCSAAQIIAVLQREYRSRGRNLMICNVNEVTARLLDYAGIKTGA